MSLHKLCYILIFVFSGFYQSLKAQATTIFTDERLSIGAGAGVEYAMLGVHAKYFFSDYLGIRGSTDYYFQEVLWQVGLELRVPEQFPKRFSPYITVSFGANSYAELEGYRFMPISSVQELVIENKAFLGITMGAGFKWDMLNKNSSYLTIGFNYRFIDNEYSLFVEDFNSMFRTDYSLEPYTLLPSIGFVLCINRENRS